MRTRPRSIQSYNFFVLFTKVQLGEEIDPQHVYLEFMEFPNKWKTKDDVLYVSFSPL